MNPARIAVFVDVENLTKWVKNSGPETLFNELEQQGTIVIRKAYGSWGNPAISSLQISLDRMGFDLVHSFHPVSGKNSADIQFTIDVMEYALTMPELDYFVLATGDSDFSSLFRKLRMMGKDIIGVGPRSPLSKSVQSSCSRFVYTDTRPEHNDLDKVEAMPAPTPIEVGPEYHRAMSLARNTLRSLNGYAHCSELRKRMVQSNANFDESKFGFKSFKDFLRRIVSLQIVHQPDSGDAMVYILKENRSPKQQPAARTPETTVEMYQRFLRKKHWRAVDKDKLITIYNAVCGLEPLSKRDIEVRLQAMFGEQVQPVDIHKSIAIFMKSALFSLSLGSGDDTSMPENKLWKLESKEDFLREIDFSLLVRLRLGIEENNAKLDRDAISEVLYGQYSDFDLRKMIADAGTKLIL